jgi:putative aldouronate transport system permease protein
MNLGIINKPIDFLTSSGMFWVVMAIMEVWKETGWGAIIYLAAIASIPQEMYESAKVDGAGRIRRIISITLPGIRGTVIILLILTMGNILSAGANFEQSLLFGNSLNYSASEILNTYVLRLGLKVGRFSFAGAAGLFCSVISVVFLMGTNWLSKKIADYSLF